MITTLMPRFESRLKSILTERNITQQEFSKMTGIRMGTVSKYCTQRLQNVNANIISVFLETLGLESIDDLIEIVEK